MNTYIFRLTNKDGCEWIGREGGEEEALTITAPSVEEAFKRMVWTESIDEALWEKAEKKVINPQVSDIHFPIHIEAVELVGTPKPITQEQLQKAMQSYIDESYKTILVWAAEEEKEANKKQTAIDKLRNEASKLGLTLEDLK